MLGRSAPGIRCASGPVPVTADGKKMKPINIILLALVVSLVVTVGDISQDIMHAFTANMLQTMFKPEESEYIRLLELRNMAIWASIQQTPFAFLQGYGIYLAYRIRRTSMHK